MNACRSIALIAAAAMTLIASPVLAQDDAKAQFQARYVALRAAMEAHDAAAVGKVFAPGYTMTDIRGEVHDGAEVLDRLAKLAGKSADPSRRAATTVLSASIIGDTATVEQQLSAGGKRAGDDGQEHTMEVIAISSDTWVRQGGTWRLQKSVQKDMTIKRDGEVFFHQGK